MKQIKIIFIAALMTLALSACKKKEEGYDRYAYVKSNNGGTVFFKINGQPWNADIISSAVFKKSNNRLDILSMFFVNKIQYRSFGISDINLEKKVNTIYSVKRFAHIPYTDPHKYDTSSSFLALGYEDETDNWYDILETAADENQLFIDSYDENTKQLKGHFHLTMYRTDSDLSRPADFGFADTIRITDGVFDLKVVEQ